ncbi:MAG: phosphoglycerate dehydrogenase [Clostridia bacterium]|nr:phosphoglycerate dehydrogenase [Clostridia bacterium]
MYQVKLFNKISNAGLGLLKQEKYNYSEDFEDYDAIMVRSAKLHDLEFPKNLKCIARAGAGVNNIPLDKCTENGIVVFNTPGANANAVKELVLCALLLSSRNIVGGANWVKTLAGNGDKIGSMAEKGKSNFAGPEIAGKTLGVIGLGAIGVRVANAALELGMDVIGYDPYLSVNAALQIQRGVKYTADLNEIFVNSDYITVHVPLMDSTRGIVSEKGIAMMKDGVRILNFARDGLCDEDAVIKGLESGKIACYCCDFASEKMLAQPNALCLPHLGASTPESEDNCARMAAEEMMEYLEKGTIRNSVNFPNLKVPREADIRICIMHRNTPNLIAKLSTVLSENGINIENMGSRPRGEVAYTIMETNNELSAETKAALQSVEGVISFRVIE